MRLAGVISFELHIGFHFRGNSQLQQDGVYRPTVTEIEELAGSTVSWLMGSDLRFGTVTQFILLKTIGQSS